MLHQYKFKNYLSFMDETTVSLVSTHDDKFITEDFNGSKLSLATAVIGANASGKTSLLKPIALLEWLIKSSFQSSPELEIPAEHHFFSENKKSEFEFIFSYKRNLYKYEFIMSDGFFLTEKFSKKGASRFEYILKRAKIPDSDEFKVTSKIKGLDNNSTLIKRKNASILAMLIQFGIDDFQDLSYIFQTDKLHHDFHDQISSKIENISFFQQLAVAENVNKNKELMKGLKNIILQLDLGISDINLKKIKGVNPQGKNQEIDLFIAKHKTNGKEVERHFFKESSGTQSLLHMFARIYPVLQSGGIFAIDEIEADLHPMMVKHILNLFATPEINKGNAQIIFTTHSLEVINLLEKSQIYLVEKNDCVSESWRLDEIEGVRRDDNYYAKYMAGAYGAIPKI